VPNAALAFLRWWVRVWRGQFDFMTGAIVFLKYSCPRPELQFCVKYIYESDGCITTEFLKSFVVALAIDQLLSFFKASNVVVGMQVLVQLKKILKHYSAKSE
jgi:hypothetical protein